VFYNICSRNLISHRLMVITLQTDSTDCWFRIDHLYNTFFCQWTATRDFSDRPSLQRFFCWRIFAKSLLDFELCEGISWKKWPKFARFRKNSINRQIFIISSSRWPKYGNILIFSTFHISTCGQIWLNHFQDDSHLGYITKLEKETLGPEVMA